ncbi:MAG: hypothetical protein IIA05_05870 [Proteobacteria bacterium]|nr:hypothetical protein [Pseudomonadota bacterium]MCH9026628.1 hypothetical protein [Pseudomonadota bacterium]
MAAGFQSKVNKTILTSLLCFSLLSACAIREEQTSRRTVDMTHVKSLNQQAKFRNVDIIWVNPPTIIENGTTTTIKIPLRGGDADSVSDAEKKKNPQQQ